MSDFDARVRAALETIEKRDPSLAKELKKVREAGETPEAVALRPVFERIGGAPSPAPVRQALETIVLRRGRPVLLVSRDEPQLEFSDAESEVWRNRLSPARANLVAAIKAVGRIELRYNADYDWVGTGWLVAEDVIVTNRHVAREFGERRGEGFTFRMGTGSRVMQASVDFLEEFNRTDSLEFAVDEILHIEDEDGPDMALLRLAGSGARGLAAPIPLATRPIEVDRFVAVIGYPARDIRIPEQKLMEQIFGDVYEKKRLAPGMILGVDDGQLRHDCSTLGGNSGSVVFDYERGEAVGLHFSGRFLEANYGVLATDVAERLALIGSGGGGGERRGGDSSKPGGPRTPGPTADAQNGNGNGRSVSVVVPVRVTVEIGDVGSAATTFRTSSASTNAGGEEPDEAVVSEGRVEDYSDRNGYAEDFLGADKKVPLPSFVKHASDVLEFGDSENVLDYEHFSVVMSRSRRLCFFSAVNIDGKTSKKSARPGWRLDPRIPNEAQVRYECYGNAPKFARGHMTRREDPVWGPRTIAMRGNSDSMHVTNVVPQMQPFNAGVWLGLEDYALQNAREDDQKISVITGPFLLTNDPEYDGVRVPRSFWKIIVFVHDQSGKLTATGYTMNQEAFLEDTEFVYGQYVNKEHETTQVSIASIEKKAGLSFGRLSDLDPFGKEEGVSPRRTLRTFEEIRFV